MIDNRSLEPTKPQRENYPSDDSAQKKFEMDLKRYEIDLFRHFVYHSRFGTIGQITESFYKKYPEYDTHK